MVFGLLMITIYSVVTIFSNYHCDHLCHYSNYSNNYSNNYMVYIVTCNYYNLHYI